MLHYCAKCGQHTHESARGLAVVLHDTWHDVTHLDGRLWRTLAILFARPGALTREYFDGRRARYLPPVRLYLVLSILFFALALPEALGILARASPGAAWLHRIAVWLVVMYAPWYTYAALRRYYQQGRLATSLKYVVVGMFYGVGLLLTLIGVALLSALES